MDTLDQVLAKTLAKEVERLRAAVDLLQAGKKELLSRKSTIQDEIVVLDARISGYTSDINASKALIDEINVEIKRRGGK